MAIHGQGRSSAHSSSSLALPSASVDLDQVRADAASAERKRILDIMSAPEARANPALAMKFAYEQSLPASQALETLRVIGAAAPPTGTKLTPSSAADTSWDAIVDQQNAAAGLAAGDRKASTAADSWDDVFSEISGNRQ